MLKNAYNVNVYCGWFLFVFLVRSHLFSGSFIYLYTILQIQFTLALCIDMKFQELKFFACDENNRLQATPPKMLSSCCRRPAPTLMEGALWCLQLWMWMPSKWQWMARTLLTSHFSPWALPSSRQPTLHQQQPGQALAMAKAAQVTQMSPPVAASSQSACRC